MSSFIALNIEPDSDSEEEIDDTKEIQIEEALKLYHQALKLHSQGPEYYSQADEAYRNLFKSEIFNYPESLSDYKRIQLQDFDTENLDVDEAAAGSAALDANDTVSNALPHTIYLAYKNRGQFALDELKNKLEVGANSESQESRKAGKKELGYSENYSRKAIEFFGEALERDDTDLELWRKTARIGQSLQSSRVARFCLETVLEGEDDLQGESPEPVGLEQALAGENLRQVLQDIRDDLWNQRVLRRPKKALLYLLQRQMDPYPYLPNSIDKTPEEDNKNIPTSYHHLDINASVASWSVLGKTLLQFLSTSNHEMNKWPGIVRLYFTEDTQSGANPPSISTYLPEPSSSKHGTQDSKPMMFLDPRNSADFQHENSSGYDNDATGQCGVRSFEVNASSVNVDQEKQMTEKNNDSKFPDDKNEEDSYKGHSSEEKQCSSADAGQKPSGTDRKRSCGSLGNDEPQDGGRTKSKRLRARESIGDTIPPEETVFDQAKCFEDRLETYIQADNWMFGTVGSLLYQLGVNDLGAAADLRRVWSLAKESKLEDISGPEKAEAILFADLRKVIDTWSDEKHQTLLRNDKSHEQQDGLNAMKKTALNIFFERSHQSVICQSVPPMSETEGLSSFLKKVNDNQFDLRVVAFCWLEHLLGPNRIENEVGRYSGTSNYSSRLWPAGIKRTVIALIQEHDEFIYFRLTHLKEEVEEKLLSSGSEGIAELRSLISMGMEMSQSVFELNLEIYTDMKAPESQIDPSRTVLQNNRLGRWSSLSLEFIYFMGIYEQEDSKIYVSLRHLWSYTSYLNMTENAERPFVLRSLYGLKNVLQSLGSPVLNLPNNTAISEISERAINQEVSRLSSMDFFLGLFESESNDSVHLIESIEPILEPSLVKFVHDCGSSPSGKNTVDIDTAEPMKRARNMESFLNLGDATLRLFLWRRLQDAYLAIDHLPKVISCYLKSIDTIVRELQSPRHMDQADGARQKSLLKWISTIEKLLIDVTANIGKTPDALDCFDIPHLQESMSSVARLSRFLHSFFLFEDSIRVGQRSPPDIRPVSTARTLEQFKERLRGMQVMTWVLQYDLIKESMQQNKELFDTPYDDRINYLRSVHNGLGIRSACKAAGKLLLRTMKIELLTLPAEENYEADIAQLFFDLYGLKFGAGLDAIVDHDCPLEVLDRTTAIMIIDFIMMQAKRINIKDLPKSELKSSIDTVQMALGPSTKSSPALMLNKRIISSYLKSPINQERLFRCTSGVGEVSTVFIRTDTTGLAEKGWYFLLGFSALTKFRSQKRVTPVATDDLDLAIGFFRQELEHGVNNWETWYRLAQTYDSKLEEEIAWSADKLNKNKDDLISFQRRAIHAYTMAVATAMQSIDLSLQTKQLVSCLLTEFGCRIYASTREPLSMEAFSLMDFSRHFSSFTSEMYKSRPFSEMRLYSALNFSRYLFELAMEDQPDNWINYYMHGKCLWKMYNLERSVGEGYELVTIDDVLDSIADAIDSIPSKRDSRSERILEPHYKLISIVQKLVARNDLSSAEASEKLLATPYGRTLSAVGSPVDWKLFILEILKNIRSADKSNWHHRIAVRIAHTIYDDTRNKTSAAEAKAELSQIFTKTHAVTVWRPEFERPGRHFVYTARYVRFFVELLDKLDDRASMDMLLRRVRKKPMDYFDHTKLWEQICVTYMNATRRLGKIPANGEDLFKQYTYDDFMTYSARLETWCRSNPEAFHIIEMMRDAIELKKLNNALMKTSIIEDLIIDIYAYLYGENLSRFVEEANEEESRERMKVDHLLVISNEVPEGIQTPPVPVAPSGPGSKPRIKGINRKDILRKAEAITALISRSAPKPARPIDDEQAPSAAALAAPIVEVSMAETENDAEETNHHAAPAVDAPEPDNQASHNSSAANSMHDDADDESDLSDLGKSPEPSKTLSLFPSIVRKRIGSPKLDSEASTTTSLDGVDADREGGGDPRQVEMEHEQDRGQEKEQESDQEREQSSDGADLSAQGGMNIDEKSVIDVNPSPDTGFYKANLDADVEMEQVP